MKKRLKQTVLVIVFILLAVFAVHVLYRIVRWKDTTGDYISSIDQLKNTPEDTIDAVFVGSSHVYCGVNPAILWEDYGYSTFDMAVSGQSKEVAYHGMVELLKTQSPKVVFVDLYALTYKGAGDIEGNVHRNLLCLPTSPNSVGLLNDYLGTEDEESRKKMGDYFFRWPIVHTRYRELQKWDYIEYPANEFLRGESMSTRTGAVDLSTIGNNPVQPAELSEKNLEWLNSLKELSEKENFRLCLFLAPCCLSDEGQAMVDGAKLYAEENGITFMDFSRNKEVLTLNGETDFVDNAHLNINGSKKLTDYLGKWLSENETLSDHRAQSGYECWERDLEYYHKTLVLYDAENAANLREYLNALSGEEDYTIIICKEFVYDESQSEYADAMSVIGVSKEEFAESGVWVYKENGAKKIAGLDSGQTIVYSVNDTDNLIFHYNGDYQPENLLIGKVDYSNAGFYMAVTVYDKELKSVVSDRGF